LRKLVQEMGERVRGMGRARVRERGRVKRLF
jgi:hypothetical protein